MSSLERHWTWTLLRCPLRGIYSNVEWYYDLNTLGERHRTKQQEAQVRSSMLWVYIFRTKYAEVKLKLILPIESYHIERFDCGQQIDDNVPNSTSFDLTRLYGVRKHTISSRTESFLSPNAIFRLNNCTQSDHIFMTHKLMNTGHLCVLGKITILTCLPMLWNCKNVITNNWS